MIKIVDSIALLESQAEDFENKAKVEKRKKNYAEAILFFFILFFVKKYMNYP